jgi:hypothetical protein
MGVTGPLWRDLVLTSRYIILGKRDYKIHHYRCPRGAVQMLAGEYNVIWRCFVASALAGQGRIKQVVQGAELKASSSREIMRAQAAPRDDALPALPGVAQLLVHPLLTLIKPTITPSQPR